jgi:Zn finger protein HypA/HybF involved in hydrogenase expression
MNLREKCKAFMHNSKELSSLEDVLSKKSIVVDGKKLGNLCVSAACYACQSEFAVGKTESSCMNCGSTNIKKSLFQGVKE